MLCPKCRRVALVERRVRGVGTKVDWCPGCKGVWFDRAELGALLDTAVKDLAVPRGAQKSAERACPRCGRALYASQYPQTCVRVDLCKRDHGLWLDAGELREIRVVRDHLKASGELDERPLPRGVKGALIRFINTAIETLSAE